jgi:DNA-binding MarR family transcriptional regulator
MSDFPLKNLPKYECLSRAAAHYPELDPSACQAFLHLLRGGAEAFQLSGSVFAEHGLSQGGFMVLMFLADVSQCRVGKQATPAELADLAGVTRATMTGLVDTLERDGYVKRVPDPADRRKALVHLTPNGREILGAILPGHFQRIAELMKPLTESERGTLVRLLDKVFSSERLPAAKSTGGATGCTVA